MKTINEISFASLINNAKDNVVEVTYISNSAINRSSRIKLHHDYGYIAGKVSGKFLVNADYAELINSKLRAKGIDKPYEVGERPYGSWVSNNSILELNGVPYLRAYYKPSDISFEAVSSRGVKVPEEYASKHNLIKKYASVCKKQMDAGLSADECVLLRNIRLDSIVSVIIDGEEYELAGMKDGIRNDVRRTMKDIIDEFENLAE